MNENHEPQESTSDAEFETAKGSYSSPEAHPNYATPSTDEIFAESPESKLETQTVGEDVSSMGSKSSEESKTGHDGQSQSGTDA